MSGAEIISRLVPGVGHAVELLTDARDRIGKLPDGEFHALLKQLAAEPADEVTALISSFCLSESHVRFLKLTLPSHA